ncbi:putative Zn finger-like uncharacterized protein [Variovorax beijingensis]|uniref:Putative Zn finger-like uncharacterized protein n=1 Tax=Variovorax beijingensis TaxID=2496117 RepID=A0A561CBE3_9BURK|nr:MULTISPECIES: zinc-ribbon and DUF3426 domain-containing protein [Variovorax]MDR6452579.1 putative Zn finger-like uncharacterized protein [Variovorax paradoxus]TWD88374.1 putative Zn finger-like uncharacterized protein [Variovorax beijingensis]
MSLVTRCPACATTFKVVRDQLRISDGWVRCGRCSHVFDATLDLHEAPDGPPATSAAPPPAPAPAASTEPSSSDAIEDADFFDDEPEHREPPEAAAAPSEAERVPAPDPAPAPAPAPAFALPAHGIVADELWTDFEANEPEWRPPASSLPPFPNIDLNLAAPPSPPPPPAPPLPALRLQAREMATTASEEDEKHAPEPDRDQVQMQKALRRARIKSAKIASAKARDERAAAKMSASMVREASEPEPGLLPSPLPAVRDDAEDSERLPFSDGSENLGRRAASVWQRPGARRWLWLLAALAVLLLVVQVLRHERDGIVARQSNLRPAFAALCRATGCELTALRQIGDIVIEGAAFAREKTGNNDYRLNFTLRNGAAVPLAMPAVELSLLDTQERAVVRRVLMAADYGAPAVLAARSDQAASLPLSLSATEAVALPPIAGYRVEAFYP